MMLAQTLHSAAVVPGHHTICARLMPSNTACAPGGWCKMDKHRERICWSRIAKLTSMGYCWLVWCLLWRPLKKDINAFYI